MCISRPNDLLTVEAIWVDMGLLTGGSVLILRRRRCAEVRGQPLLLEENERLLNEGGMVLEDAAVPGVGENAQLCIRQPARELE